MTYRLSQFLLRDGQKGGEGDDGVVWKALRRSDSTNCALKFCKGGIDKILTNGIPKEVATMTSLDHPHIVKCYGWGKVYRSELKAMKLEKLCCFPGDVGVFIVLEWIDGVTLEQKITDYSFGRTKRRLVFKQLLEAVVYMHSKNIAHNSIFLDNIMVSVPIKSTSCLPRLVLCDFGASAFESTPTQQNMEKDRNQCGGVLLALFSSRNISIQCHTNKLMQKDMFALARDLIDARKPLTLEAALSLPSLTNDDTCETNFTWHETKWNNDIVANIGRHLIQTGNTQDFVNACMVSKQFYTVLQRCFLCTPQFPHLSQSLDYYTPTMEYGAPVDQFSMWLHQVESTAYKQDFKTIREFSEGDLGFEVELLTMYLESVNQRLSEARAFVQTMTTAGEWSNVLVCFHDMKGSSNYCGAEKIYLMAWYARDRTRHLKNLTEERLQEEKHLYNRLMVAIQDALQSFIKSAKDYLIQLDLPVPPAFLV